MQGTMEEKGIKIVIICHYIRTELILKDENKYFP